MLGISWRDVELRYRYQHGQEIKYDGKKEAFDKRVRKKHGKKKGGAEGRRK